MEPDATATMTASLAPRLLFVAANPSIDRLYEVDRLAIGGIHRPLAEVAVPGGKGLNAARAAATLGGSVTVVGIVAGRAGEWIVDGLATLGIEARMARGHGRDPDLCVDPGPGRRAADGGVSTRSPGRIGRPGPPSN